MGRQHRSTFAILFVICIFNILLRYPRTEHEMGIDSFVFHSLANSLLRNQAAPWVINPLSYFGLYPLSEPGGSVFSIAVTGLVSGLTVEVSILAMDIVVSMVGVLGAFILGREFFRDDRLSLAVSLLMSTTPEFVTFLFWQVPTRITFTALLPYLLVFVIRFSRRGTVRNGLMMSAVLALMMSFHRLAILTTLILFASFSTAILLVLLRTLRTKFPQFFLSPIVSRNASWFAAVGIMASAAFMIFSTGVLESYSEGEITSGNTVEVQVLNLAISLSRSAGLLLPLTIVGVVGIMRRRAKDFSEPFLVLTLLSFIPTLFLRQYTGFYTIPLTSLFAVIGLAALLSKVRSAKRKSVVVGMALGLTLVSSYGIISYDLAREAPLDMSEYDLGVYSASLPDGTWVFGEGLLGARFSSVSGNPYLPIGGATTPFQGPELLAFGFVNANRLDVRPLRLIDLTIESDSPFYLEGVQAEADWATLHGSSVDSMPAGLMAVYQPRYLVTDDAAPFSYYAYGNYYSSQLALSAYDLRYAIFADGKVTVWLLQ